MPPAYDEAHDPAGQPRPHWAAVLRRPSTTSARPNSAAAGGRPAPHPRERRHLQRVRRPPRHRPPVAARPDPARSSPPAEAAHLEAGLVQRARLLELVLADLYGPQQLLQRRPAPAGVRLPQPRLPAAVPRRHAARRALPAPLRRQPRPRRRRPVARPRRPHPGAVRRRVRAGKPHRHDAHAARRRSATAGSSGSPCSSRRFRDTLRGDRPAEPRQPARSCCSRRGRTTRRTSSTPTSPATSATRSSRAATSPSATTASS